jgi:hypothetical protein
MSVLAKNFLTLENTSAQRSGASAERSALVAELLRRSRALDEDARVRLLVHGESMLPSVWPGDVVEIAGCSFADVRPGEIVLALRDGRLFLHRLVAIKENGFVLRGDSIPGCDPTFSREALLGRLVRRKQNQNASAAALFSARWFRAGWFGAKWSRALGMFFCHCGMARDLALKFHHHRITRGREFRNFEAVAEMGSAELQSADRIVV